LKIRLSPISRQSRKHQHIFFIRIHAKITLLPRCILP